MLCVGACMAPVVIFCVVITDALRVSGPCSSSVSGTALPWSSWQNPGPLPGGPVQRNPSALTERCAKTGSGQDGTTHIFAN